MADTTDQPKIRVLIARQTVPNVSGAKTQVVVRVEGAPIKPEERNPLRLVLAIDISDSMTDIGDEAHSVTKLGLTKQVVHHLIKFLAPQDTVGLVIYSDHARLVFTPQNMTAKAKARLARVISDLRTEYSTNISDALQTGCEALRTIPRLNAADPLHLLLLTDGEATAGIRQTDALLRFIKVNDWARDVRVLTAGFGVRYNAELLSKLATETHGEFAHIQNQAQFAEALGDLLGAAASAQHVNLEVAFVPADGIRFTNVFTTDPVEDHAEHGAKVVHLGDVFAESVRAVAAEFELPFLDPCPTVPVPLCRVVVRGVDVKTGETWQTPDFVCQVEVVPEDRMHEQYDVSALQMLVELMAKAAVDQALAHARNMAYGLAIGRIEQVLSFVSDCGHIAGLNLEHVLDLLKRARAIVSDPAEFRRADHGVQAETQWFGKRATGRMRQTRTQQAFTRSLQPRGLLGPGDDDPEEM